MNVGEKQDKILSWLAFRPGRPLFWLDFSWYSSVLGKFRQSTSDSARAASFQINCRSSVVAPSNDSLDQRPAIRRPRAPA
jgi:hypothetical protein